MILVPAVCLGGIAVFFLVAFLVYMLLTGLGQIPVRGVKIFHLSDDAMLVVAVVSGIAAIALLVFALFSFPEESNPLSSNVHGAMEAS